MIVKSYIKEFETLGFGMFVHFGIYSTYEQGEWYRHYCKMTKEEYETAMNRFRVHPDWAKNLAKTAKAAGCKYITLTTRHHDGFSLYDTCGLNTYDAPHSPTRRDLVRDFVDACRAEGAEALAIDCITGENLNSDYFLILSRSDSSGGY